MEAHTYTAFIWNSREAKALLCREYHFGIGEDLYGTLSSGLTEEELMSRDDGDVIIKDNSM